MLKFNCYHPTSDLYGADRIFVSCLKFILTSGNAVRNVYVSNQGPLQKYVKEKLGLDLKEVEALPVAVRSQLGLTSIFSFVVKSFLFLIFSLKNYSKFAYVNTLSLFILPFLLKVSAGLMLRRCHVTLHVHELVGDSMLGKVIISIGCIFSDKVIVVSDAVKNDLIDNGLFSTRYKVFVVRNGIDDINCEAHSSNFERTLKSQSRLGILVVGRLMPAKGQWLLVDAIAKLSPELQEKIHVTMLGSPPPGREYLQKELEHKISSLSLSGTFTIKGFSTSTAKFYDDADISIVPSLMRDPFPTTVLESMMHSLPIITSDGGGAVEIVSDSFGIVFKRGSSDSLKDAISCIISKHSELLEMGCSAREHFRANYQTYQFEKRFLLVLEESK